MTARKHITPGEVFHQWTYLREAPNRCGRRHVTARCRCGKEHTLVMSAMLNGHIKSCGCHNKSAILERNHKHGMSHSSTYEIYMGMMKRCYNPKTANYHDYGGRGIAVCDRWRESFVNFLEDMGERPADKSLDRYPDMNGNYEPGNCRWATRSEQNRNKRNNRFIEFNGEVLTLSEWARKIGVHHVTIISRIDVRGWTIERALTTPARKSA